MSRLIMLIATGFGVGRIPFAPGTWGSLLALPLHWFAASRLSMGGQAALIAAVALVAVWSAGGAEKILDRADPGCVVIDEVAGMLAALAFLPASPGWLAAGFLLFRLFDIAKPFPVGWLDRHLHGGPGIVIDDLAAGAMSAMILHAVRLFLTP